MIEFKYALSELSKIAFDHPMMCPHVSEYRDAITNQYSAVCAELEEAREEANHYKEQLDLTCKEGLTPADAKKLREANHGLASELEEAQKEIARLNRDAADLTGPVITYHEFISYDEILKVKCSDVIKLKADTIREAADNCISDWVNSEKSSINVSILHDYANKLERGES